MTTTKSQFKRKNGKKTGTASEQKARIKRRFLDIPIRCSFAQAHDFMNLLHRGFTQKEALEIVFTRITP